MLGKNNRSMFVRNIFRDFHNKDTLKFYMIKICKHTFTLEFSHCFLHTFWLRRKGSVCLCVTLSLQAAQLDTDVSKKKKKRRRKSRKSYLPIFESSSLSHTQYKHNIYLIKIKLIALGRPLVVTRSAAGAQFVCVFNAQLWWIGITVMSIRHHLCNYTQSVHIFIFESTYSLRL